MDSRIAYFLGANDPYCSLKTTLNIDTSRLFEKPRFGWITVKAKVVNHLGDDMMKVFKV